jgi:hypothetical protein
VSALKICPQCGTEYELDQRFCPKDGSTLKLQNAAGDLVGSIIHKSYHVLRKLGEGGMGTVYLAVSPAGGHVAVKVIRAEHVRDPAARARFHREVDGAPTSSRSSSGAARSARRAWTPWPSGCSRPWPRSTPPASSTAT